MKNRMQDVRDHLVAMMEALADKDVDQAVIDRAKATAAIAQTFTNTVKVELDFRRAAAENGVALPEVLQPSPPPAMRLIDGSKK